MAESFGYTFSPYSPPFYYAQALTSPIIPDASLYPLSPFSNPASLPATLHYHSSPVPPLPWSGEYHYFHPSWGDVNLSAYIPQNLPSCSRPIGDSLYPYSYYSNIEEQRPLSVIPPYAYVSAGYPVPAQPAPFYIHPLLNGEIPRSDFIFNLPSRIFSPSRFIGLGQTAPLSYEELSQPATYPPISHLTITCDAIPQWPIQLAYNTYTNTTPTHGHSPPPITLGDILGAIHRSLHTRITHADWAQLNTNDEIAVARAYTKRCRSSPHTEDLQRTQGVKRVDFLLERVWFKGLLRDRDRGDRMKMIIC